MKRSTINQFPPGRTSAAMVIAALMSIYVCPSGQGHDDWLTDRRVWAVSKAADQTAPGVVSPISIDYPQNGSIFPPEITVPTFIWHDRVQTVTRWEISIAFGDGHQPIHILTSGDRLKVGESDPRCVSETNRPPSLTPDQASAHTWTPSQAIWEMIKKHSLESEAKVQISGFRISSASKVSDGLTEFTISNDPVGAPIFYRDVPLMPSSGEKGVVQPLAPDAIHLINWRLRDISQRQSRIVLHEMPTCANCHSFALNGKTMGIDVDGPGNDKGLYALVRLRPDTVIRNEDVIAWNTDQSVGKSRVGFMSQVSPTGRYVLTTFAGPQQELGSSYYVRNFKDYRFLQVFYPTRGVLMWYDSRTKRRQRLPGADDPDYVQTDGVWSPDEKYIVFARAKARDPFPAGQKPAEHANDENETQIRYDLYRIPFDGGKGGKPEPIAGASDNGMSNNFPKISPDGRWIVFVKCRNGQLMRPDSKLYIVSVNGGAARRMRCNTSQMNSWHSFSPNGRWMVFSSKSRSPYTQMYLTHIDKDGQDSPAIYIEGSTAANRAVNIPEFVNIQSAGLQRIEVPAADYYRIVDHATALQAQGKNQEALNPWQRAVSIDPADARAQNGLAITLYLLGRYPGAAQHFSLARKTEPAGGGDPRAKTYLALMFRDGKGVPRDASQALNLLKAAAEKGYAPAQFYLAGMLGRDGVVQDDQLSVRLYQSAAEQDYADAQIKLGLMYRDGQGVPKDPTRAIEWFGKAADSGNPTAQYELARMLERGDGIAADSIRARELYEKAAKKNYLPALEHLGAVYASGPGPEENLPLAAEWYRKAALLGSVQAQLILGAMYHSGQGIGRSDREALKWLEMAADQQNPEAQYLIGTIYSSGGDVPPDSAMAEHWYRKAAENGSAVAQFLLGTLLIKSDRPGLSSSEAAFFLDLASSCTQDEANRATILSAFQFAASRLNDDEREQERSRAKAWLQSHQCL